MVACSAGECSIQGPQQPVPDQAMSTNDGTDPCYVLQHYNGACVAMMVHFYPMVCTGLPSAVQFPCIHLGTMPFVKSPWRCPARFSGRSEKVRLPTGSADGMTRGRSASLLARQNCWQPTGEASMLEWLTLPGSIWYLLLSTTLRRAMPPLGLSAGKRLASATLRAIVASSTRSTSSLLGTR